MRIPKIKQFRFASLAVAAIIFVHGSQSLRAQDEPEPDSSLGSPTELLHWKMFNLHPRLAARATYDDNINLRQTNVLSDILYSFSPGLSLVGGDPLSGEDRLITLDYGANFQFFATHDEFNSIDQSAKLSGTLPFSKLTLGISATYDKASTPDVELGNRVTRGAFGLGLTARYDLSPKTSLELNGGYHRTDYPDPRLINSQEYLLEGRINNQVTSKINLGVGATLGKLDQDRGSPQIYERALIHAIYTLTAKLDLTVSAGGEWRQYGSFETPVGSGTNVVFIRTAPSASFAPIFDITASYRPREGTTIHLDAFRHDQNSPTLAGFNYTSTGFTAGIQQQFLERFSASFGGSYEISSYHLGSNDQSATRDDSNYAINAGLDWSISEKWVAGITALHRAGVSSAANGIIFDNNQITFQTSYKF